MFFDKSSPIVQRFRDAGLMAQSRKKELEATHAELIQAVKTAVESELRAGPALCLIEFTTEHTESIGHSHAHGIEYGTVSRLYLYVVRIADFRYAKCRVIRGYSGHLPPFRGMYRPRFQREKIKPGPFPLQEYIASLKPEWKYEPYSSRETVCLAVGRDAVDRQLAGWRKRFPDVKFDCLDD